MLFKTLIANVSLLVSFMFIGGEMFKNSKISPLSSTKFKIFAGIIGGGMGICLMLFSYKIPPGVVLDLRHFAIMILAIYGGMTSAIVTGLVMSVFRIGYFGINSTSIVAVVLIITFSVLCVIVSRKPFKKNIRWLILNVLGILTVSTAVVISIKDSDKLFSTILLYTIVSSVTGLLVYYLSNYLIMTHILFNKYKTESMIADNLTDLISTHSFDGSYIYVSASSEKLLSYNQEELIGNTIYSFCHPDDISGIKNRFLKLSKKEDSSTISYRFRKNNGKYVWLETTIKSVKSKTGEIEQLICVSRDISERRNFKDKLVESENKFRSLVQSMNDMIYTLDVFGKFTGVYGKWVNHSNDEDFIGKTISDIYGDEDAMIHEESYKKALMGQNVLYEWINRTKSGIRCYQISLSPITNSRGNITGIVGVGRDISNQKVVERELVIANEKLKTLSFVDGLTNIPNRRYFDETLKKEWNRGIRDSNPISMLILDIDHFKIYNDTYGHQQGDECLKKVAKTLIESVTRSSDLVSRFGGEEFAIILPNTDTSDAKKVGERLRNNIENLRLPNINSTVKPYVTVSVGVATVLPSSNLSPEELIEQADKALYSAKNNGRNRVELYEI